MIFIQDQKFEILTMKRKYSFLKPSWLETQVEAKIEHTSTMKAIYKAKLKYIDKSRLSEPFLSDKFYIFVFLIFNYSFTEILMHKTYMSG